MTRLDQLVVGARARVGAVRGPVAYVQRLMEMGVFEGEIVEVIGAAPLGDPIEIRVGSSRLSLRRDEAAAVEVELLV
jgi:ferrous iron transport protein A